MEIINVILLYFAWIIIVFQAFFIRDLKIYLENSESILNFSREIIEELLKILENKEKYSNLSLKKDITEEELKEIYKNVENRYKK